MKNIILVGALLLSVGTLFGAVKEITLDVFEAQVKASNRDGYSYLEADGLVLPEEPVGAPLLPVKYLTVEVPDGADGFSATFDGVWEKLGEGQLLPVQPIHPVVEDEVEFAEPDDTYYAALYPETNVEIIGKESSLGKNYLTIKVTPFRYQAEVIEVAHNAKVTLSYKVVPVMKTKGVELELSEEQAALHTNAIYTIVAAPDLYEDFLWYAEHRKAAHPELTINVVSCSDIYAAYPYGANLGNRNPAESIHNFVRNQVSGFGTKYLLLGGMWMNAQNLEEDVYYWNGEKVTIDNTVPGITCYPSGGAMFVSDQFFGCVDLKGAGYPWDANGDGKYLNEGWANDIYIDIAVGRLALKPDKMFTNADGSLMNRHQLLTNYVYKLERGESPTFKGRYKYGMLAGPIIYSKCYYGSSAFYTKELEYYDCAYNMWDHRKYRDYCWSTEASMRRMMKDFFAPYRPILDCHVMNNTETSKGIDPNNRVAWWFGEDREFAYHIGHGWAKGSDDLSAVRIGACTGLTTFLDVQISCYTGYIDWREKSNGTNYVTVCLGDASINNPKGGGLCSMHNNRPGAISGGFTDYWDSGYSSRIQAYALFNFIDKNWTSGDSWKNAIQQYAAQRGALWVLIESIFNGDPYVKLYRPGDVALEDGAVFDETAENVYLAKDATLNVTNRVSAVKLYGEGDITLNGSEGDLRVMGGMEITNGTLTVKTCGGIGTAGVTFVGEPGKLVMDGDSTDRDRYFYLAALTNCDTVVVKGCGALLDWDGFEVPTCSSTGKLGDGGIKNLIINGAGKTVTTNNVIRASGGATVSNINNNKKLRSFDCIAVTNAAVNFQSVSAFKWADLRVDGLKPTQDYYNAAVTFGEPVWRGHAEMKEYLTGIVKMHNSDLIVDYADNFGFGLHYHVLQKVVDGVPTYYDAWYPSRFLMSGTNTFQTTNGGIVNLCGTNTVVLADSDTKFVLAAKMNESKGELTVEGPGVIEIPEGANYCGKLTIKSGTTLKLDTLPLTRATALTMEAGSKLILPDNEDGFYQIVPVSSRMTFAEGVEVYRESDLEHTIKGVATSAGVFCDESQLLKWAVNNGVWMMSNATMPWTLDGVAAAYDATKRVYFPDVDEEVMVVKVGEDVTCAASFFGNAVTKYVFNDNNPLSPNTITFDILQTSGETDFTNQVVATGRIDVQGSRLYLENASAPEVNVEDGSVLAVKDLTATTINLEEGGALEATGNPVGAINIAEGAILKAMPEEVLELNDSTSVNFDGCWYIDTAALTLTEEMTPVIAGDKRWSAADLVNFRCSDTNAEVRVDGEGRLGVIAGENLTGPYYRSLVGEAVWNELGWNNFYDIDDSHVGGKYFEAPWSEMTTKWYESATLYLDAVHPTMSVDTEVVLDALTISVTNQSVSVEDFTLSVVDGGSLTLQTLDLAELNFPATLENVSIGSGKLYLPSQTITLDGGSGTVVMNGGTLDLKSPCSGWTIAAGSAGTVVIEITDEYKGGKGAFIQLDPELEYPSEELRFEVEEGFEITREGNTLYLSAPAVRAYPEGGAYFSKLQWYSYDGEPVVVEDWNEIKMAELVITNSDVYVVMDVSPTTTLQTSGTESVMIDTYGDAHLPDTLTINTPTLVFGSVLPELKTLGGTADLTLTMFAEVKWNFNQNSYIDWTRVKGDTGHLILDPGDGSTTFTPTSAFAPKCPVEIRGLTVALGDNAASFTLASGSYGTFTRNVTSFTFKTDICAVEEGYTADDKIVIVASAENMGEQWTDEPLIENNRMYWNSGKDKVDLTADANTVSSSIKWDSISSLTLSGASLSAVPACPEVTLQANPVGKLAFKVNDLADGYQLMQVAEDFTWSATSFHITASRTSELNTDDWSWAVEDGYLVYHTHSIDEVRHGLHFDGNFSEFGTSKIAFGDSFHSGNARPSLAAQYFLTTDHGKAWFGQNLFNWGGTANLSGDAFSIFWRVRASTTVNAIHLALGSKSAGGITLRRTEKGMELIRYDSSHSAVQSVVGAEVTDVDDRYHNYLAVYRNGVFTFYADGEYIGEAADPCDASSFKSGMNWQVYSIHGGNVNGITSVFDGAFDEWRVYDWALEESSVKNLQASFPVWPEYDDGPIHVASGETVEIEMERADTFLYGREVTVEEGGVLNLYGSSNLQLQTNDLSFITGYGTVVWNSKSGYMSGPKVGFAPTLTLEAYGEIPLSDNFSEPNAWEVRNLSGSANFRADYGTQDGKARQVRTTQTMRSEFSGTFAEANKGRTTALIVAGSGAEPTVTEALTLSGTETSAHKLTIETNGCVKVSVNANWLGEIENNGILIIAPPTETTYVATNLTLSGSGTLVLDGSGTLDFGASGCPYVIATNPRGTIKFTVEDSAKQVKLAEVADGFSLDVAGFAVELTGPGISEDAELVVRDGALYAIRPIRPLRLQIR